MTGVFLSTHVTMFARMVHKEIPPPPPTCKQNFDRLYFVAILCFSTHSIPHIDFFYDPAIMGNGSTVIWGNIDSFSNKQMLHALCFLKTSTDLSSRR